MSNENIKQIVQFAIEGDYVQTESLFKSEMADRVEAFLDTQKEVIAQSFFEESVMTGKEKNKAEIIIHGMKKNEKDFKNRYGKNAKNVMYATANKMAMSESVLYTESAHEETLALIASNIANMAKDGKLSDDDQAAMSKVGDAMKTGDIGEIMKHIPVLSTEAKESLKTHIDPKYHQSMGLTNEIV